MNKRVHLVQLYVIGAMAVAMFAASLSLVSPVQAQEPEPGLQVWTQHIQTEHISWRIFYRAADGTELASFDLPPFPLSYPENHIAGRLIGTDQTSVLLFTPYSGVVETLPVPDMPADFGGDHYMVTGLALSPDGEQYAYNLNHQPADYTQPADTRLYIATPHVGDDRMILNEQNEASYATEPLAWSADKTRLLIHSMPQGIGGYILFWTYREARILDIATGATQPLGDIDGYSANLDAVALVESDNGEITGLAVTDVASGRVVRYPLPDLDETPATGGNAQFSPDGHLVAYQVARHDPEDEVFWTILVDRTTGASRLLVRDVGANWQMQYGHIAGWMDNSTLAIGGIWAENTVIVDVVSFGILRTEFDHVFLGYATGIMDTTGFAAPTVLGESCPGTPIQRLRVGMTGRITFTNGALTNVRDAPGADGAKLASLPEGSTFTVLDGPVCAGNYSWWKLEFVNGLIGWVAEGDPGGYFLELWP